MNAELKQKVEAPFKQKRPDVRVGDVVKLHMKIKEGDKTRIQIFQGIVISLKGEGLSKMITVRKISSGVGVERIVPLHSPNLEKIEIVKRGKVRRSKLYYLRNRIGKAATRIKGLREYFEAQKEEEEAAEDFEGQPEGTEEEEVNTKEVKGMEEEQVAKDKEKNEEKGEEAEKEKKEEEPKEEGKQEKEEAVEKEEKKGEEKEEEKET